MDNTGLHTKRKVSYKGKASELRAVTFVEDVFDEALAERGVRAVHARAPGDKPVGRSSQ